MTLDRRIAVLEDAITPVAKPRWHRLSRYEGETHEQAVAAYEAEHGPIGNGNVVMRVIIEKPGERPGGVASHVG